MRNSELFSLLRTLNDREFKRLEDFVNSPYHRVPKQAQRLFLFIKRYYPKLRDDAFDKYNTAHKFLYPDQKTVNEGRIRTSISQLKKAVEEFLRLEELSHDETTRSKLYCKALEKRGTSNLFQRAVKDRINNLDKQGIKDIDYYDEMTWLSALSYSHPENDIYNPKITILTKVLENLDRAYVLKKIRYSTDINIRSNNFKDKYAIVLYREIIDLVNSSKFEDVPILLHYQRFNKLTTEFDNYELFNRCLKDYREIESLIGNSDKHFLLRNLISFASNHTINGDKRFSNTTLNLYKELIDCALLIRPNELRPATFINVAVLGSLTKEFQWTKEFIEEHSKYLDDQNRESAVSLSFAYHYFHRASTTNEPLADYERAFDNINKLKSADTSYQIRIRSLLLKIYFEFISHGRDYNDSLVGLFDSLKKFYDRNNNNISENRVMGYKNFVATTQKLHSYRKQGSKLNNTKLVELEKEIEDTKNLISRAWLKEKINELKIKGQKVGEA